MSGLLEGKVAIVTGVSSGIGKSTALLFAKEGASLVLVARRENVLEDVRGTIEKEGGKALVIPADLTKTGDVDKIVGETVKEFGNIDILVNFLISLELLSTAGADPLPVDDGFHLHGFYYPVNGHFSTSGALHLATTVLIVSSIVRSPSSKYFCGI